MKHELFHPEDTSNCKIDHIIEELAFILAESLLKEFTNPKKATYNHLLVLNGSLSWANVTEEDKLAGLGMHANNNISESVFGGLTE